MPEDYATGPACRGSRSTACAPRPPKSFRASLSRRPSRLRAVHDRSASATRSRRRSRRRRSPARSAAGRASAAGCSWRRQARAPCTASGSCSPSRPTAGRTSAARPGSAAGSRRSPPRTSRSCAPGRRSCRCAATRSAATASRSSAWCRTALRAASGPCHATGSLDAGSDAWQPVDAAGGLQQHGRHELGDHRHRGAADQQPAAIPARRRLLRPIARPDEQVRRPGQRRVGAGEEQLLEDVAPAGLGDRRGRQRHPQQVADQRREQRARAPITASVRADIARNGIASTNSRP